MEEIRKAIGKESESLLQETKKHTIPKLGRSSGEGNGNPLQYSCLENRVDRGAWRAMVHGVTESQTRLKQLSTHRRESREGKGF